MTTRAVYDGIHTYIFIAAMSAAEVCPLNISPTVEAPPAVTDSITAKKDSPKVA